ncbi:MAG: hypothetical protein ACE1Y2_00855, partial [Stenotrophomonas maltophilia]
SLSKLGSLWCGVANGSFGHGQSWRGWLRFLSGGFGSVFYSWYAGRPGRPAVSQFIGLLHKILVRRSRVCNGIRGGLRDGIRGWLY